MKRRVFTLIQGVLVTVVVIIRVKKREEGVRRKERIEYWKLVAKSKSFRQ